MPQRPRVCIDRSLPSRIFRPIITEAQPGSMVFRAVAPLGKQWINGTKLRIRFTAGTDRQVDQVMSTIKQWESVCNIGFEVVLGESDIRIAFDEKDGAWSYIGTDCRGIPQNEPTMNFGWLDQAVILHEFGHALGMAHEHSNPAGGIEWNEPQVIADLSGPPNFWDESTIRYNVLRKYSADHIRGTKFDPDSIMLYSFPASWTKNNISTHENSTLSSSDRDFIATVMYPKEVTVPATRLSVGSWFRTRADIGLPGEEDIYDFVAEKPGRYLIDTIGDTDVAMRLYGPDSQSRLIAEDDNSGIKANPSIRRDLTEGQYWIQIRHSNRSDGVGSYRIKVRSI